ncbi:carboxymuconolactone decarboxylase family protein [Advenella mimigardefordensis]|uniref:Alkylhydroperoxidase-like domain-containing protein n=1 Tax=Advenella mimigardefordensis (strain DSM 17166 / LMG 22922 / DPN7) TaxID=1247726 RepID=W0PFU5_ADVMD|nr:hypothetical protein [Advenella mimigardefordensis]AHG64160.1 alkylhydroperoxidase-like domain-containing protein [Advenella mimigardefordensis DPN7]
MSGSFLKSLPDNAAPPTIYTAFPEIYQPWAHMSEALMSGESPLSKAERELIFAYAAGLQKGEFVYIAHAEVAYALGVDGGLIERLLENPATVTVSAQLQPVLEYVRKLAQSPELIEQSDVDAIFDAGWSELVLHHIIGIVGRAAFMVKLTRGYGFVPLSREKAARHAQKRVAAGYVNLYPAFKKDE